MASSNMNFQKNPLKIYIQDVFRAERSLENNYIYQLFGLSFKNVMIHGVVTSIYNTTATSTNFELSDPTASVQVYFDSKKNNSAVSTEVLEDLDSNFADTKISGDKNLNIMNKMMEMLAFKKQNITFDKGSYLSVIGDIFLDLKGTRMVSAYECKQTSENVDILWLEELRWLYEKFYLWSKE